MRQLMFSLAMMVIGGTLFMGCQESEPSSHSVPASDIKPPDTMVQDSIPLPMDTLPEEPERPIDYGDLPLDSFTPVVDSIFEVQGKSFFTVRDIPFRKEEKRFALALSHQGLQKVTQYGTFFLLEYTSDSLAQLAYAELPRLARGITKKEKESLDSRESFDRFYKVVYKGGALYALRGRYIVHRGRKCSEDHEQMLDRESRLLDVLYRGQPPVSDYYFSYCCSCPPGQNVEVR